VTAGSKTFREINEEMSPEAGTDIEYKAHP
jgi:hypothetical protein